VLDDLVDLARQVLGADYAVALLVGPDASVVTLAHHSASAATTEQASDALGLLQRPRRPVDLVAVVLAGTALNLDHMGQQVQTTAPEGRPTGQGLPGRSWECRSPPPATSWGACA
jgi:GAF domain-containing protein